MRRLYQILRTTLWAFAGVFLGHSIYLCYDYVAHPALYAMQSAPWYTGILVYGAFTAVLAVALLIAMKITKKRIS